MRIGAVLAFLALGCGDETVATGGAGSLGTSSGTTGTTGTGSSTGPALCMATPPETTGVANGPECAGAGGTRPDNELPTIQITHPAGGQVFGSAGMFTLTFTAADDDCVSTIDIFVNGEYLRTHVAPPFETDFGAFPWGTHTLGVEAIDREGNRSVRDEIELRVCAGPDDPW